MRTSMQRRPEASVNPVRCPTIASSAATGGASAASSGPSSRFCTATSTAWSS